MIPVTQTKVVVKNSKDEMVVNGNCWAAAIASILELPISEVPNFEVLFPFVECMGIQWMDLTRSFLFYKGYRYENDNRFRSFHKPAHECTQEDFENRRILSQQYYLVSGKSPRGVNHVTIWQDGFMVHDPHPTREGILEEQFFEAVRLLTEEEKANPKQYSLLIHY